MLSPVLLDALTTPTVRTLGDVASEAHHAYVVASILAARHPLVEAHYDHTWWNEDRTRRAGNRADLWLPADNGKNHQCYVEIKLALLYDTMSRRLGAAQYGLQRGAPEWAYDIYRLLVGPAGPTHAAFLLCTYSADGSDLLLGATGRARQTPAPLAAGEVDADDVHQKVEALADATSTAVAIRDLADIVARDLRGTVTHVGGPRAVGAMVADPIVFEWEQADRQRSAWMV
jgi:hypothetical protein